MSEFGLGKLPDAITKNSCLPFKQ